MKREFIFPMNYKNKEKFLGFIDYKIVALIGILALITFFILKTIPITTTAKIVIFILVVGFFSILMVVGVNGDNMLDFLYFMGKYFLKEKVYVYRKNDIQRRD